MPRYRKITLSLKDFDVFVIDERILKDFDDVFMINEMILKDFDVFMIDVRTVFGSDPPAPGWIKIPSLHTKKNSDGSPFT